MESKAENAMMHALTAKATRDAAVVKVLTVIMLVYLPTTVVLVSTLLFLHGIYLTIAMLTELFLNFLR
jgi:hypothetical protein